MSSHIMTGLRQFKQYMWEPPDAYRKSEAAVKSIHDWHDHSEPKPDRLDSDAFLEYQMAVATHARHDSYETGARRCVVATALTAIGGIFAPPLWFVSGACLLAAAVQSHQARPVANKQAIATIRHFNRALDDAAHATERGVVLSDIFKGMA